MMPSELLNEPLGQTLNIASSDTALCALAVYKALRNGNEVSVGVDDPAAVTLGDWTDQNLTFGLGVERAARGWGL
jgi:hypothetical protein